MAWPLGRLGYRLGYLVPLCEAESCCDDHYGSVLSSDLVGMVGVFVVTDADRIGGKCLDCHDWSFADTAIAPPALHEVESVNDGEFACPRIVWGAVKVFQKQGPENVIVVYC